MKIRRLTFLAAVIGLTISNAHAHDAWRLASIDGERTMMSRPIGVPTSSVRLAAGRTCKAVSTCRQAVELWCGGYPRADADSDGVPCEGVCNSLGEVEALKKEIGC